MKRITINPIVTFVPESTDGFVQVKAHYIVEEPRTGLAVADVAQWTAEGELKRKVWAAAGYEKPMYGDNNVDMGPITYKGPKGWVEKKIAELEQEAWNTNARHDATAAANKVKADIEAQLKLHLKGIDRSLVQVWIDDYSSKTIAVKVNGVTEIEWYAGRRNKNVIYRDRSFRPNRAGTYNWHGIAEAARTVAHYQMTKQSVANVQEQNREASKAKINQLAKTHSEAAMKLVRIDDNGKLYVTVSLEPKDVGALLSFLAKAAIVE